SSRVASRPATAIVTIKASQPPIHKAAMLKELSLSGRTAALTRASGTTPCFRDIPILPLSYPARATALLPFGVFVKATIAGNTARGLRNHPVGYRAEGSAACLFQQILDIARQHE